MKIRYNYKTLNTVGVLAPGSSCNLNKTKIADWKELFLLNVYLQHNHRVNPIFGKQRGLNRDTSLLTFRLIRIQSMFHYTKSLYTIRPNKRFLLSDLRHIFNVNRIDVQSEYNIIIPRTNNK